MDKKLLAIERIFESGIPDTEAIDIAREIVSAKTDEEVDQIVQRAIGDSGSAQVREPGFIDQICAETTACRSQDEFDDEHPSDDFN